MLSESEVVILTLLSLRDTSYARPRLYGLELVEKSRGRLKKGTVYVSLSRLEGKGLVSRSEPERKGCAFVARPVYALTSRGVVAIRAWRALEEAMKSRREVNG